MEDIFSKVFDPVDFQRKGHALIDLLSEHITSVVNGKVKAIPWESPEKQLEFWKRDLNEGQVTDPTCLFKNVMDRSVKLHSPKYFGHQTSVPAFDAVLAGLVSELLNNGMGVYEMGMAGNAIEKVVIDLVAHKMGFSNQAAGFITSGGSLGNLTALLAARAASSKVWTNGSRPEQDLAIMVSEQAHYSVYRAAKIIGLGEQGIIKVPVDDNHKIRCDLLEQIYSKQADAGVKVFCMIACAASTAIGAYDDIETIAKFCDRHDIWLHTDGAHGAAVVFSQKYKELVKGIEQSDSVLLDFHKMMMTPSLSTSLIFRSKESAMHTFSQQAHYLWNDQQADEWYNSGKRTFECTKAMSSLKIYTLLKMHGLELFSSYVEKTYALAREFAIFLNFENDFEIAHTPESNVLCFRYKKGNDLNQINNYIRQALLEDGEFYIVQTTLNENVYLRISLMNPLTEMSHLRGLVQKIRELANLR